MNFKCHKIKVYCQDCAFFSLQVVGKSHMYVCKHPQNFQYVSMWRGRVPLYQLKPEWKNKGNHCLHFKEES